VPLTALAGVVALAPIALFLERPRVLLYVAAASTLSALLYAAVYGIKSSSTHSPSLWELLLGGLSALYLPALMGISFLSISLLIYGLAWAMRQLFGWLGLEAQIDPGSVAQSAAAVLTVIAGFVSGTNIRRLRDQLYPDVAGFKSAFYDMVAHKQRQVLGCTVAPVVILGAVLIALALAASIGRWIYVCIEVYLVIISAWLWTAGELPIRSGSAIKAIARLFDAVGYEVTLSPRTGDETVDPLLVNVDLLAQGAERSLAVQVQTSGQKQEAIDWTLASTLQAAAWRLSSVNRAASRTPYKVEPLLVLVGIEPDESLASFSKEEEFNLLEMPGEALSEIRLAVGLEERQELAHRYLSFHARKGEAGDAGGDQVGDGERAQ
jgi:hypothetical protein